MAEIIEFFNTDKITVFPSSLRVNVPQGKYTSERNFANILNSITNVEHNSYVVSFTPNSGVGDPIGTLDVVLAGYFFTVNDFDISLGSYLSICIEKENGRLVSWNSPHTLILDDDASNKFLAVYQSSSAPTVTTNDSYSVYSIQTGLDENGNLKNTYRLNGDSVSYGTENSKLISVNEKIDQKQKRLSTAPYGKQTDSPIKISGDEGEILSFNDSAYTKLADESNKGSDTNPVYTDADGHIVASKGNVGSHVTEGDLLYGTNIYMKEGVFNPGQTMYISTSSPDNTVGNIGDFWFKYEKNS